MAGEDQESTLTKAEAQEWLHEALVEETAARAARWDAIGKVRQALTVREIATAVARSGLAGQEVVRVHLAALRLAERATELIDAVAAGGLNVQLEGKRGEPGRYVGVRMALESVDPHGQAPTDEAYVEPVLRVLRAGNIIPAIPPEQVGAVLRDGGSVWLITDTD
jgi:hypothetical protein